jgi:hypothetical protein
MTKRNINGIPLTPKDEIDSLLDHHERYAPQSTRPIPVNLKLSDPCVQLSGTVTAEHTLRYRGRELIPSDRAKLKAEAAKAPKQAAEVPKEGGAPF